MRIKDLPTKEDISNAYVAVDDDNGSGKVPVSDIISSGSSTNNTFIVNVTMASDGTLSSDKTFEEISSVYNESLQVIQCHYIVEGQPAAYPTTVLDVMMIGDHQTPWTFQRVGVAQVNSTDYALFDMRVMISNLGEVTTSNTIKNLVFDE